MAGQVVASEQEACTVTLLPGGGAEQDPRRWWEQVAAASSRLMARGRRLAGIGGRPSRAPPSGRGPCPSMSDGQPIRRRDHLDGLARRAVRAARHRRRRARSRATAWSSWRAGCAPPAGIPAQSGKDPIAHILWLKHQEPETYHRARVFLEPKDWLNACLTGRAGGVIRLDRAALGDRQPSPGPHPL